MKRTISGLVLLLVASACSERQLTIIGEESANLKALEEIAESYPGDIEVHFEGVPFGVLLERSNQDLALGTGQYDVIMQYNFTLSSYVENDLVWNSKSLASRYPGVDSTFEVDLFPAAWREVGFYYSDPSDENSQPGPFGYPFATNTLLLVINRDLFNDPEVSASFEEIHDRPLAPPTTWDEFSTVAKFFSENTNTNGVVLQGASGGWLYYEWAAIMSSQGLSVFPEKNFGWERGAQMEANLLDPALLEATEAYLALQPFNSGGFENVDASVQVEILKNGDAAMGIVWSDYVPDLLSNEDRRFDVVPLPGEFSPLAGGAFYINKGTKNPKEAYEFITWLLQPEQQRRLLRNSLGSPSSAAYTDQVLAESAFARAMQTSIARGVYAFEANKDSELVNTAITTALQRAWRNPEDLSQQFSEANQNINRDRATILNE